MQEAQVLSWEVSCSAEEVQARGRHLHRKQGSFCSLPAANAKSPLWALCGYAWATLIFQGREMMNY